MIKAKIDSKKEFAKVSAKGDLVSICAELLEVNIEILEKVNEDVRTAAALSICDGIKEFCLTKEEQEEEKEKVMAYSGLLDDVSNAIRNFFNDESEDK